MEGYILVTTCMLILSLQPSGVALRFGQIGAHGPVAGLSCEEQREAQLNLSSSANHTPPQRRERERESHTKARQGCGEPRGL